MSEFMISNVVRITIAIAIVSGVGVGVRTKRAIAGWSVIGVTIFILAVIAVLT